MNKPFMTTVCSMLFATLAQAQTSPTPNLDQRQAKQQERIAEGIESGRLTAGESAKLERREARLESDKKMAAADGVVTTQESKRLQQEANADSRAISRLKHNGRNVQPLNPASPTAAIDARQARQQNRIAQGIESGHLTAGEAARLEGREARLQSDKKMAQADGVVTAQENARLQHEANRDSKKIYRAKHNAHNAAPAAKAGA